jgi:hypothetical protein
MLITALINNVLGAHHVVYVSRANVKCNIHLWVSDYSKSFLTDCDVNCKDMFWSSTWGIPLQTRVKVIVVPKSVQVYGINSGPRY